jgi:hypothetical protein
MDMIEWGLKNCCGALLHALSGLLEKLLLPRFERRTNTANNRSASGTVAIDTDAPPRER